RRPRLEPGAERLRPARRRERCTRIPPQERAHGGRGCSAREVKLTPSRLWLGVFPAIIAFAVAGALMAERSNHQSNPTRTGVILPLIGIVFVISGLIARTIRPQNDTGLLLALVGFLWLFNVFWQSNSRWALGLAAIFGSLFLGAFVHLMLAYPEGRLGSALE